MSLKKKTQSIRLNEVELANFCRQIGMVISAGLPIYYGISILMGEAEDENTKALYESLYEPMETGVSFNQALKEVDCFPEYMVKMIQLGEETAFFEKAKRSDMSLRLNLTSSAGK